MNSSLSKDCRRRLQTVASVLASLLALTGCGTTTPTGQTVATVNGDPITQLELSAELNAQGGRVSPMVQQVTLQSLIDRKLAAQAAVKDGLDKDPQVVLAIRREREAILASKTMQMSAASVQTRPTDAELGDYIDRHPAVGANRRLLVVDQLKFVPPGDQAGVDAIKPVKTMDALIAVLTARGVKSERGQALIDTATLPDGTLPQLLATTAGEPLILVDKNFAIANVITGTQPVPDAAGTAESVARRKLVAERYETAGRQRQAALRNQAKIEYAAGYSASKK